MLKHLVPIVAATLLLLIVWASAVPLFHWFQIGDSQEELLENQAKWQRQGVDSYEYIVRKSCFCGPPGNIPVKIVVRDSLNIAAFDNRTTYDPAVDKIEGLPQSIPALFDLVRLSSASQPDSFEVEYNETFGFPESVRIDSKRQAVDDEVSFVVQAFRVIDEPP